MSAFTRLGAAIWDWEPWTELNASARVLWLALYTSAEAKRHVPGLWQGGIPAMADAGRMPPDEVIGALDQLLEREMVEYDPKVRVLRLCQIPDAGEWPSNGNVIKSWYTRFRTVPDCPVRNAHVATIAWMLERGAERSGKGKSEHHLEAWKQTFGLVVVPTPRRRGLRRLSDNNDTSTLAQPSLFQSHAASIPELSTGISSSTSYPQVHSQAVDNSDAVRKQNEIRGPETVSETVSDTVSIPIGSRIPDPGSRIYLSSPERGIGGGHDNGMRPSLTLVPPYSPIQVFAWLAQGNWDPELDKAYQNALGAIIPAWAASAVGPEDFARLAAYNAHIGRRWNARMLVGCDIHAEIATARRVLDWRDVQAKMLDASMGKTP